MKPADYDRFAEVLRAFAELKGKALSAPALELYWRAMQDWTLAEFQAAAAQLVRTSKFFPSPSEFEDLRKAGGDTAGEAFNRAREHARSLPTSGGFLQEVPSGDAALDAAARAIGGYRVIANAGERDLQFIAQNFAEHYREIDAAQETRAALPDLTGGLRKLPYDPKRRLS